MYWDITRRLKSEQSLLVDFSTFPTKVIDLLDTCIRESAMRAPRYGAGIGNGSCATGRTDVPSGPLLEWAIGPVQRTNNGEAFVADTRVANNGAALISG
jgi:hypothetical protein